MQRNSRHPNRTAAAVLTILLLAAAAALAAQRATVRPGTVAVVSVAGQELYRIDLAPDAAPYTIDLSGEAGVGVVLEISDHAIRFRHSDCPDQICVHTGWISRDPQVAVCMPNQTAVLIIAEERAGWRGKK